MTVVAHEMPEKIAVRNGGGVVEVELAGAVVRVRDGVASATLRMVFDALRGAAP